MDHFLEQNAEGEKTSHLDLSKFVDVHLEGLLQSHVDIVGLVAVHGVPLAHCLK